MENNNSLQNLTAFVIILVLLVMVATQYVALYRLEHEVQDMMQEFTNYQLLQEENYERLEGRIDILNSTMYAHTHNQEGVEEESATIVEEDGPVEPEQTEGVVITQSVESEVYESSISSEMIYTASQLKTLGVINWGGYRWTWYSQRVLPGGGLNIPDRHVDENGYVCDGDGRIVLASGFADKGTIVNTPFGKEGKVYDYCTTANTYDVYTDF